MKKETTKLKTTPKAKAPLVKTIDQMSLARQISHKYGLKLSEVVNIIEEEQKLTMEYTRMGYKVIKKNYITLESRTIPGKKAWRSPLNGKTYDLPPTKRILVRIGAGFKQYVADKKMPEKLCRFVNSIPLESTAIL